MSSSDIEAINDYINRTTATTTAARADQAAWQAWYKNLSFFDKMSDETLMDASAKRDRFNIDNKTPPIPSVPLTKEEADYFLNMPIVNTTGMTQEEAQKAVWNAKPVQPQPVSLTVSRATIRQGSKGDAVKEWQRIVGGIAVDGSFGPATVTATKRWQKDHGLKEDGIVGPQTWGTAYGDLPKLNPEKPSASTDASAKAAQGPAQTGTTYSVAPAAKTTATSAGIKAPVRTPAKTTTTPTHATGLKQDTTVPKQTTSTTTTTTTVTPTTLQAGFLSGIEKLPTWSKWVAGILALIGFGYGIKHHNEQKELAYYPPAKKKYRK